MDGPPTIVRGERTGAGMTKKELLGKIEALGLPENDDRIKSIVCSLIGHSNIIINCFGYITCARCGEQLGDVLAGIYHNEKAVIVGHNCEECSANYKKMNWKDKFMCPDLSKDMQDTKKTKR